MRAASSHGDEDNLGKFGKEGRRQRKEPQFLGGNASHQCGQTIFCHLIGLFAEIAVMFMFISVLWTFKTFDCIFDASSFAL